jgi:3-oxo-5alpha-steroid 4-dehydrogenase
VFGTVNLHLNRQIAPDLQSLATACDLPVEQLVATIESYNEAARAGSADAMGKDPSLVRPVTEAPFAAVPCHLGGVLFPAPCITLGGLDVDGATQQVRRDDGSTVAGLFAVGRSAAGIASRSYVSGLSLADCVFSGRNAGRALAGAPPVAVAGPIGGESIGGEAHGLDQLA